MIQIGGGGAGGAGTPIFGFTTQTQNAGVGLEDLATFVLPAGTLSQDGDWLEIRWAAQMAATGNNKTTAIVFGASTVASRSGVADSGLARWHIAVITRKSATLQEAVGDTATQGGQDLVSNTAPASNLDAAVTIAFRVQGGAAGDIINRQIQIFKGSRPANFTV